MTKKRILVVDDQRKNLALAIAQLSGEYEVDTAGDFIAAVKKLRPEADLESRFFDTGVQKGPDRTPYGKPVYDAVLTDLYYPLTGIETSGARVGLMEPSDITLAGPLGIMLALYAARYGVPYIGIHTDGNHHSTPMTATFDLLYSAQSSPLSPNHQGRHAFR